MYLYTETAALGEETRVFVKDFERNSVTWSDYRRQYVFF